MRQFLIEEPEHRNDNNNEVVRDLLLQLLDKLNNNEIIVTGKNASQSAGQESYVELSNASFELDPYSPFISIDNNFKTPKKYFGQELDWYKSMDLSIIGHPGIETNPTWNSCCTQDDKKEVNSNYGWCVFSEENGSQYDNCYNVLAKDSTSRNGLIIYTRPNIHSDMFRDGAHDQICTVFSQFFIRDGALQMTHVMRSSDIRFGLICSDLAWTCFVYQHMYKDLLKVYPDLKVGKIFWLSTSLHLYSRHYENLKQII
jgi:thymidylate synthase